MRQALDSIERHAAVDRLEELVDGLEKTLPEVGRLIVMRYFWGCSRSRILTLTGLDGDALDSKLALGML